MQLEVESAVRVEMPDGLQVGDELVIEATAIVAGIETELVDVTSFGDEVPKVIPGERKVKLLLLAARV